MRTEKELIAEAIQVQNACNLSGVVHSFSKAISELWELNLAGGTKTVNQHRVCRLYADKIKQLAGDILPGDFSLNS